MIYYVIMVHWRDIVLSITVPKTKFGFAANTYIIERDGEMAVIDPATHPSPLFDGHKVKYVLLTHAHFDHMLTISEWVEKTGAELIVSAEDAEALTDGTRNCYKLFLGTDGGYYGEYRTVKDGDTLPFGNGEIEVMATPGHTAGSVVYLIDGQAFVGDTVFAGGGYGRCNLPSGDASELKESINKILALQDDTGLLPGHGPRTTVAEYKKYYNKF